MRTRRRVETVLRKLGADITIDAILIDHPRLTHDDILAAQSFAADYLADEDLVYGKPCDGFADECVDAGLVSRLRDAGRRYLHGGSCARCERCARK
jgi:hypothetical protein